MPRATISPKAHPPGPTRVGTSTKATQQKSVEVAVRSIFDLLPDSALLRQSQLVRSPKRPNSTAPLPFSAATLWRRVAEQKFPAPVKLSERITAWRCGDVKKWLGSQTPAKR